MDRRSTVLLASWTAVVLVVALALRVRDDAERAAPTHGVGSGSAGESRSELDAISPSLREAAELPADPREPASTDVPEPTSDDEASSASAPSGSTAEKRPRIPREHFDAMYAGLGLEDIAGAKARVEKEFFRLQEAAIQELLEAGRYETVVTARPGSIEEAEPEPFANDDLIHGAQAEVTEDGKLRIKRYSVPYAEYVHVYDKQDELTWLQWNLGKLLKGE